MNPDDVDEIAKNRFFKYLPWLKDIKHKYRHIYDNLPELMPVYNKHDQADSSELLQKLYQILIVVYQPLCKITNIGRSSESILIIPIEGYTGPNDMSSRIIDNLNPQMGIPTYLTMNLKRVIYDRDNNVNKKIRKNIPNCIELDLKSRGKYKLLSVIIHIGENYNSGHYYMYKFDHDNDGVKIYELNDKTIKKRKLGDIVDDGITVETNINTNGYIFLYKQIDGSL